MKELAGDRSRTHGRSRTPEYCCWQAMIQRCINPHRRGYENYGGRGISVCDRWRTSFENFTADMGPRPPGHSLDRIDNDGNYEPGNCRWATNTVQLRNRGNNRLVTFNGETLTISEWAEKLNVHKNTLTNRIDRGWSVDDAFTKPVQARQRT
jgi:hypothetical protein